MASAWAPTSSGRPPRDTWIADGHPVRAIKVTRQEAEALGAMALFGEKYGDWVRAVVEVEDVSRELCGGTHTATTAELGLFEVTTETSSASNVRRIEALTEPAGAELFEERSGRLGEIAAMLRVPEHEVVRAVERLVKQARNSGRSSPSRARPGACRRARGERRRARRDQGRGRPGGRTRPQGACPLRRRAPAAERRAAVVLGTAVDGEGRLVANFAEKAVQKGLKAGAVIRTTAQAGKAAAAEGATRWPRPAVSIPSKLPEALAAARAR